MRCRHTLELLPTYVVGQLAASRSRSVEEHLRECRACGREEGALRELLRLTNELDRHVPSELGVRRVKGGLEQAISLERLAHRRQGVSPAWRMAAVVCFLAALGLAWLQFTQASEGRATAVPPAPSPAHLAQGGLACPAGMMVPSAPAKAPTVQQTKAVSPELAPLAKSPFAEPAASRRSPKAIRKRATARKTPSSSPSATPAPTEEASPGLLPSPAEEQIPPGSVMAYYVPPAAAAQRAAENEVRLIREVPAWAWLFPPKEIRL